MSKQAKKVKIVIDCRLGGNKAGDTVLVDEKLANELISIGRATKVDKDDKDKDDKDGDKHKGNKK